MNKLMHSLRAFWLVLRGQPVMCNVTVRGSVAMNPMTPRHVLIVGNTFLPSAAE